MADQTQAYGAKSMARKTVVLAMPDETLHQPPLAIFLFAGIVIFVSLLANIWQPFTTYIAIHAKIVTGATYTKMNTQGQLGSEAPITLIGIVIAVGAQLGVLYFVFRVKDEWMRKAQGTSSSGNIVHTAIEISQHIGLVMIWVGAGFLIDTVGDITFIGLYTHDPIIMLAYMLLLYSISTVGLVGGLHLLQASIISYVKWNAWKTAVSGRGTPKPAGP